MKLNVCHLSPINILKTVTESCKKKDGSWDCKVAIYSCTLKVVFDWDEK